MNQKGQVNIGLIIVMAVVVILGMVFIQQIASDSAIMTTAQSKTEQLNVSTTFIDDNNINTSVRIYTTEAYVNDLAYKDAFGSECDIVPTVVNVTGTSYIDPTDVVRTTTGYITLKNTTKVLNGGQLLNVTYTYCEEGYNDNDGARAITNLILVFCALGVFAFVTIGIKSWSNA